MSTDVVAIQFCCFACLQELPQSTPEQNSKSLRNLQCNEDLTKTYHKKTGIVINFINDYPKHLCQNCYHKVRAFDDFCETALDCSTALCELLFEENFSLKTLKNLQYFCSTCLCQMKDQGSDSLHLNNMRVKRWLDKCNKLKIRTGTEHWPNNICQRCCNKIDNFLEFQYIAKKAFKQLNKSSNPQQRNIESTSKEENDINITYTGSMVRSANNKHLSYQGTECLEEASVSTSYNMGNKVNAAKTFCNAQKNDTIGSLILENDTNIKESIQGLAPKQSLEKHFEVDSAENNVLNQPSSTEYYLTKQCNKSVDIIADLNTPVGGHQGLFISLPTTDMSPTSIPKTKYSNSKYPEDQNNHTNKTDIKQNHIPSQSNEEDFPCKHCRKVFKGKARLRRHKRHSLVCSSK